MNIMEVKKRAVSIRMLCFCEQITVFLRARSKEIMAFVLGAVLTMGQISEAHIIGVALGCALGLGCPWGLLGCVALSFFVENGVSVLLSCAIGAMGLIITKKLEAGELLGVVISSMASSLGSLAIGGNEWLISLFVTPVFALGFTGLFSKKKSVFAALADGGFLCLALGMSLAFYGLKIGFFSFGIISAVIFSIEGSQRGGYLLGSIAGFFSGCGFDMSVAIPLAMGGFLCGAFIRKYRIFGVLIFLTFSDISVLFFTNLGESLEFAVSSLWGAALWVAVSELYYNKKRVEFPVVSILQRGEARKHFSFALSYVSTMLKAVSKTKRKEREEKIKMVVEGVFSRECETCNGCGFQMEKIKERACHCLGKNKRITEKELFPSFVENCCRWKIIAENLNSLMEKDPVKSGVRMDMLADDYMALARLLAMGEKNWEKSQYRDLEAARKIKLSLELANIRVARVEAIGERLPVVEISGIPFKIPFPEKKIKAEVEKIISKSVEIILVENEGKMAKMKLGAICPMKADCYKISLSKMGEIVCGDTNVVFETDDGFFYSVMSDGMGSGRDAAVCSQLGAAFLEKLISSGIDKTGAVSMLGSIIASSEDEIFTTVDLVEIDLVRGKLTIIKAGAAPSWVLRKNRAYSIFSKTLPCGIIPNISAEQTILSCAPGDVIVQATDGGEGVVADVLEEIIKLKKTLTSKEIASYLVNAAVKNGKRTDDISFCVMSIL